MKSMNVTRSLQFRLIVLAVIAVGTIAFFGSGQLSAQDRPAPGTFAVIDGQRVSISVGDVLGQGQDLGNGICSVPDFDLIGQMDKDSLDFSIEVEITKDCTAVVTESKVRSRFGDGIAGILGRIFTPDIASATTTEYRIMGEYALHDPFGLCLTCTQAKVDYFDNGVDVWNGHNLTRSCGDFSMDGWHNHTCTTEGSDITGLDEIYHEAKGEFEQHNAERDHTLAAKPIGEPGGFVWVLCTRTGASNPFLTHYHCSGSRTTL